MFCIICVFNLGYKISSDAFVRLIDDYDFKDSFVDKFNRSVHVTKVSLQQNLEKCANNHELNEIPVEIFQVMYYIVMHFDDDELDKMREHYNEKLSKSILEKSKNFNG